METYSIVDRSTETSTTQWAGIPTQVRQEPGKGLTIVESARRDLEATLQLLADRAQYITGASGAAIALRDAGGVLCRASSGSAAPELGSYLDISAGLSGESLRTRTALRCDDAENDPRVDRESCRRLGIASFAVIPILRNRDAIGIFEIFSGKPHAFEERDLAALERLGEMVNTALDQASPAASQTAPFAVHGAKVKVLAATATVGFGSRPMESSGSVPVRLEAEENRLSTRPSLDRIWACEHCGFPVSEGRVLCLDCESKGIRVGELLAGGQPSAPGLKSWVISNRYVIGMILISAATIAFALLR